ncbi:hypothetical protein IAU60_002803 [Kwoniella sp. DSM 27419]
MPPGTTTSARPANRITASPSERVKEAVDGEDDEITQNRRMRSKPLAARPLSSRIPPVPPVNTDHAQTRAVGKPNVKTAQTLSSMSRALNFTRSTAAPKSRPVKLKRKEDSPPETDGEGEYDEYNVWRKKSTCKTIAHTSTPPLTDLPAPYAASTALVLFSDEGGPPESTVNVQSKRTGILHQKEPLFLPASPETTASPQQVGRELHRSSQSRSPKDDEELSPVTRPSTRRSAARRIVSPNAPSSRSTSEEAEQIETALPVPNLTVPRVSTISLQGDSPSIPVPSDWVDPFPHIASETRPTRLDPGPIRLYDISPQVLIPDSGAGNTFATLNAALAGRTDQPSSRRQEKTYSKGRSHAFQHGISLPLPSAYSQLGNTQEMSTVQTRTKRKGSTSLWPPSNQDDHIPDSFLEPDENNKPPPIKKQKFVRNGPPPDERLAELFREVDPVNHLQGHRGNERLYSDSPRLPLTRTFALIKTEDDVDYVHQGQERAAAQKRKRRRKRAMEGRHDRGQQEFRLKLDGNRSVQARLKDYVQNVNEGRRVSRCTGIRAHRRLKRIPGYLLKPLPTISYQEYVQRCQQRTTPSTREDDRSHQSGSSTNIQGRMGELISAGRKALSEQGIRKQRRITGQKFVTARLPMRKESDSPDDPQIRDSIRPELSHASDTSVKASHTTPKVLRLAFTKRDKLSKRSEQSSAVNSSIPNERLSPNVILGVRLEIPKTSKPSRKAFLPDRQQQLSTPDTPDLPDAINRAILSESPPELPDPLPTPLHKTPRAADNVRLEVPVPSVADLFNTPRSETDIQDNSLCRNRRPTITLLPDDQPCFEGLRISDSAEQVQDEVDEILRRLGEEDLEVADMMLSQIEADRVSRRSAQSGRTVSTQAVPTVCPTSVIPSGLSPTSDDVANQVCQTTGIPNPYLPNDESPAVGSAEPADTAAKGHMNGMQVTQLLLQQPLVTDVVASMTARTSLEDRSSAGRSKSSRSSMRQERHAKRASRVAAKRQQEKLQLKLATIPLTPARS